MRSIAVCFLLLLAVSCGSRSSIKIKSLPSGATVSAIDSDGSIRTLGQTPFETNESMQSFVVEKEGYEGSRIFIGRLASQHYEYSLNLTPKALDPKVSDIKSQQERLAKNLAKANNLINRKRYSEAHSLLINMTSDYPYVSVTYDLLGNISYLQKDFRSAISHYQRSLEINPENVETKQVIDRLRSMTN